MSLRPFRDIKRRKTTVINVGKVQIGGDNRYNGMGGAYPYGYGGAQSS